MNSLSIREFQQAIINFTNGSELPAEVKRLVFLEILSQINEETTKEIQRELSKRNEEVTQNE